MRPQRQNTEFIHQAMMGYLVNSLVSTQKQKKIRANMECRRKLEIKIEEQRLQRYISEFDFNE